ncbi:MAG TPA: anhydro-N-acetylmuramic acid kinase [Anaerolineae bacterium]|nr:anhydro-N-acetylmuramic acid kinase [Anaerolineae bacterium]
MILIGLMSGTSADGVDAVVVEIAGAPPSLSVRQLAFITHPWPAGLRTNILTACRPESSSVDRLCELNFQLGEAFAEAAFRAVEAAGRSMHNVDLIGSHGQTVWHAVQPDGHVSSTLQIGEPAVIAQRTGVTTVADFRVADVAIGGQGAPLVSYVDWLLLRHPTCWRVVQNIGGIANATFLPPLCESDAEPLAFDTGPGNMLIDDAATRATEGALTYDRDGQLARAGRVDHFWLAELLQHPYLQQPPPKTTGRELFGAQYGAQLWSEGGKRGLRAEDIVATLTAFTAASIALAYRRWLPCLPDEVIVGGGGARNPALMELLREEVRPARLLTHEDVGMDGDAKEALAFTVLAYEAVHGRPGNLPACTGARERVVLGKIIPGANFLRLMQKLYKANS